MWLMIRRKISSSNVTINHSKIECSHLKQVCQVQAAMERAGNRLEETTMAQCLSQTLNINRSPASQKRGRNSAHNGDHHHHGHGQQAVRWINKTPSTKRTLVTAGCAMSRTTRSSGCRLLALAALIMICGQLAGYYSSSLASETSESASAGAGAIQEMAQSDQGSAAAATAALKEKETNPPAAQTAAKVTQNNSAQENSIQIKEPMLTAESSGTSAGANQSASSESGKYALQGGQADSNGASPVAQQQPAGIQQSEETASISQTDEAASQQTEMPTVGAQENLAQQQQQQQKQS